MDCDNVPGPLFIPTLVSEFNKARTMRPWPPCVWISNGGGTTGRIAYLACTFMSRLNGYDGDLEPVGYQDIDVVNRIAALQVGGPAKSHQKPQKVRLPAAVGESIPNHPDKKYSTGLFKTLFTGIAGTFGQMDARNRDRCWKKGQSTWQLLWF